MKRSILILAFCILAIGIGLVSLGKRTTNNEEQVINNDQQRVGSTGQETKSNQQTTEVDFLSGSLSNNGLPDSLDSVERVPDQSGDEENEETVKSVQYNVPFTSQAPFGEWNVPEFQDGCEEASAIMANAWISGKSLSPAGVKKDLLNIAALEKQEIGHSTDTSAKDTKQLLLEQYFHLAHVELIEHFEKRDLIAALSRGIVLVPMNGRLLGNPNFTSPGPLHHMVVVMGYDPGAHEFITNDPGTRKGAGYRYDEEVFFRAARDYPTGIHEEPETVEKNMIVVEK